MDTLIEPFRLPFVQRGLAEILLLSIPAGLLGTWIVLRGLAFFSHGVGTAAFPGLVLADGIGFAAPLGALGAAVAFALGTAGLRRRRAGQDAAVALALAACLAVGVILASDVFGSGANIETLLFGSLLLVDTVDLALAAGVAGATLAATALVGQHWLRAGFDPTLPGAAAGPSQRLLDALLIGLVALATVAALTVVGALLVTALFVVPPITARLLTERLLTWQLLSVALVAVEGTLGLWLAVQTNAPPGATIACVAGAFFAAVALARVLRGRRRLVAAAAAVGALALAAAGCGGGGDDEGGGGVAVVATTTQVADFVREVGGEEVELTQLLHANSDPHDYEPRPADVRSVAGAELVFASGEGLDEWIEEVVSGSGSEAKVVELGAVAPIRLAGDDEQGHEDEHANDSADDPHWWHDPRNAVAAARRIERALIAADPSRRAELEANTDDYVARLRALDAAVARCVDSVPAERRKLVTDHDAFRYFANRYGIEVVGAVIPAQTTEGQPSARDLGRLAATIEAEGVRAVFPESSLSPKLARAIARQTGASAEHTLYGDTLGPDGSDGATYLEMVAANADAVVRGFTGGRRGCRVSP